MFTKVWKVLGELFTFWLQVAGLNLCSTSMLFQLLMFAFVFTGHLDSNDALGVVLGSMGVFLVGEKAMAWGWRREEAQELADAEEWAAELEAKYGLRAKPNGVKQ